MAISQDIINMSHAYIQADREIEVMNCFTEDMIDGLHLVSIAITRMHFKTYFTILDDLLSN